MVGIVILKMKSRSAIDYEQFPQPPIAIDITDSLRKDKVIFQNAKPFPHIVYDNFLREDIAAKVHEEFPDLRYVNKASSVFNDPMQKKLASLGTEALRLNVATSSVITYLNSEIFLKFLNSLTSIDEHLISDPYLSGGGYHQTNSGGFLKLHTDFAYHPLVGLDRRVNLILFISEDWIPEYGGALELWDSSLKGIGALVEPKFNRAVIFNTNDYTYHGHPEPLASPKEFTRKSIALYYYSNGRPATEKKPNRSELNTNFAGRPGEVLKKDNFLKKIQRRLGRYFL